MPELPEVETVRRELNQMIKGQTITAIDVRYPKIVVNPIAQFKQLLIGQELVDVGRRAKYLLFHFGDDLTMISHLRMEGKYQVRDNLQDFDKHVHVIFTLSDGRYLGYRDVRKFGRMEVVPRTAELTTKGIAKLGPEPLTPAYTYETLADGLQRKKKNIKTVLLDQQVVSGLGNIYVDEVLWQAQINPEEPANNLTTAQLTALYSAINDTIQAAIAAGGTTIRSYVDAAGNQGQFQLQLRAYKQDGKPCQRCGTTIEKIKVGGRGTHFCPHCQKLN
ncbi:bifunctional DNA-formamidopyrimidine glycosylase/DNA-(apurinic or apyrimidinic site) lyase [Bombilactobacillus folatiphilus]|uniref:Formamidopyrimidine-DNA glycosylase n=1 Tax=Bombilactobacillus folatiphilus TaxID=2923362 RepID=A0ABY4PAH6_9LACO|nr:bifunctional DNA-formamidopyrimidine glycosylase/DNA-(apurinic or apyrimidinic site) lyase [Bombilactobacillus folatiphilus]UQS82646.1 bifunctional DNA-formamidopyrimidine glycosylase/DNA-(apurinic or apyrimidinic site) lyase [Bombilactobacillus folatiphilus]